MKKVINITKYLNDKKIVHRDLNTENLLIYFEPEDDVIENNILKAKIKLIDYSLSTRIKKGELLDDFHGRIINVAPEIFRKKNYDEKVDIWSLGVLCSKLLTKEFPFDGQILINDDNVLFTTNII